ncbi:AP-3 adaptor complex subunit mu [Magnaporthiopsis poae ATCC 64411]|uniref:AP-3 adaptor complex subunit mu n=1 Tax=Magnaporthiopsis poae (strain ATCC 64411 / 73-15) TaxID=644358 RepID=A0A0C4E0E7_MAGP6|nr:AP-3 adaptor complex subunit mu [Magnaporthiopsis poae ATCC 64411]
MTAVIEALHIYDERNSPILSHTYTGRPLSAAHLLPLYLEHPPRRPSLIYLPNASPATLVFSLTHANLLLLATASREVEPLLVLEFLHRVVDAFEEFLGAPLTAQRIDSAYDIAAQLLTEMCDAGVVATTEPNALRDLVEVEGLLGKLLGGLTLPGAVAANLGGGGGSSAPSLGPGGMMMGGGGGGGGGRGNIVATPALPWRRANVRHTSNEMYADLVETLSVTLAPSGRPLAAFAHGTVAFTSKVSGVPDIVMSLTGPTGRHNLAGLMELPVFHPCVRLARWREHPGELSFIPPDGRFILASYEVDLLPFTNGKSGSLAAGNLKLPANIEVKTGLGPAGSEFEVRVYVNKVFGAPGGGGGGGDWLIPNKALAGGTMQFSLRGTVVGDQALGDDADDAVAAAGYSDPMGFGFKEYNYEDPEPPAAKSGKGASGGGGNDDEKADARIAQNKLLMPSSASLSFSVKGWLPSGIKVESIVIDQKRSMGLTASPYKGVKYLTVSKGGVELRC